MRQALGKTTYSISFLVDLGVFKRLLPHTRIKIIKFTFGRNIVFVQHCGLELGVISETDAVYVLGCVHAWSSSLIVSRCRPTATYTRFID